MCLHGFTDTWRTRGARPGGIGGGARPRRWLGEGRRILQGHVGFFTTMQDLLRAAAPHAEAILASAEGRRRATQFITTNFEHIPAELLAHLMRGAASCEAMFPLIEYAMRAGWSLDAEKITCHADCVWGADDKILSWPSTAARFRDDWLPHADWVELEGVGHCPQLDIPL